MDFIRIANELNDIHQLFIARFAEESSLHGTENPLLLQTRLKVLQKRTADLSMRIQEVDRSRQALLEALAGAKSLQRIADAMPVCARSIGEAEKKLSVARSIAFKENGGVARTHRDAKRSVQLEHDSRHALAFTTTLQSTDYARRLPIDVKKYEALDARVRESVSLSDLEAAVASLLRRGGKIPRSEVSSTLAQALIMLSIIEPVANNNNRDDRDDGDGENVEDYVLAKSLKHVLY